MKFINNLSNGDTRTVKAKKNIIAAAFIKGADAATHLLLVPLTLGYLNAYEYGIWLALSSILTWINTFDIGLGNGLRNRLSEALAKNDKEAGRAYVSTTLLVLLMIVIVLIAVFTPVIYSLDWFAILNVTDDRVSNLVNIVYISFLLFFLNFAFKFIGNVYQALQLPAMNVLIVFLGHFLSLIAIFVCTKIVPGSLLLVAIIYSASPLIVYLAFYPFTFFKFYPYLRPSFKYFKRDKIRDLLSLSVMFFLVQIGALVLLSMSNILISNLFGPEEVTPYSIAYRYFSLVLVVFSLLITPLWSAVTEAYVKKDYGWINRIQNKMIVVLTIMGLILILMLSVSKLVYSIWIGNQVKIPFIMSLLIAIYVYITMWSVSYSYFLNGMNKLGIQAICTISMAILFIPTCYFLSRFFNVLGIILGMCILNIPGVILNYVQYKMVIKGTDKGIWSK